MTGQRENLCKAFNDWLVEVNLFFELEICEGESQDYVAKSAYVLKKEKSLFIDLLGRKGQQIYQSPTFKNVKGEIVENDNERTLKMVFKVIKDYYKPMKTLTIDRV